MASLQQTKLIKKWEKEGYMVVNLIKTNKSGITDLLALKNGTAIFIESKEHGDSVKELQEYRMKQLSSLGFKCYVNEQPFEDWLEKRK
tara:strand:- start:2713 stop:2976 length:264 start_codon:yes stop_codon:yes gene_type:complete